MRRFATRSAAGLVFGARCVTSPGMDFLLNPTNTEVDGTVVAWEFLAAHRLT